MIDTPLPPAAADLRYSRGSRLFHWWMFGFVTLAYALVNLVDLFERGTPERRFVLQSHFLVGTVVLLLVLPRFLHRLRNAAPPIVPPIAAWEAQLSHFTHMLLYAFLLLQPLLGLFTVWLAGRGVGIPGTALQIPSPLAENHDLHEQFETVHVWLGEIFYYVIGLHIVGALWHHFVRRDSTLRRFL
jgi:cytochrome b561